MNTIHKFKCPIDDSILIKLPRLAKVLCVQLQNGEPYIWVAVDTEAEMQRRRFHWRGTGHDIKGLSDYVGTVQLQGGALVFHLFQGVTLVS